VRQTCATNECDQPGLVVLLLIIIIFFTALGFIPLVGLGQRFVIPGLQPQVWPVLPAP